MVVVLFHHDVLESPIMLEKQIVCEVEAPQVIKKYYVNDI